MMTEIEKAKYELCVAEFIAAKHGMVWKRVPPEGRAAWLKEARYAIEAIAVVPKSAST